MTRTGWGRRFAAVAGMAFAVPLGAASPETPGMAAINASFALPASLHAPRPAPKPRALIAIIIDDLGQQGAAGLRTVNLPGAVACAFVKA